MKLYAYAIAAALLGVLIARLLPPYQFIEGDSGFVWRCNRITGEAAWTRPGDGQWHYVSGPIPSYR